MRRGPGLHDDGHAAGLGEFDGIAHEVHEHLLDAPGIAAQPGRQVRRELGRERQAARAGARREQGHGLLDLLDQAEILRLDAQLAGLDLREIQDVVDDGEQVFRAAPDHPAHLPLVRGQRAVEEQVGHADDTVHRRADLVAHVGEELRLQARGRQRLVARRRQAGHELLRLGDVLDLRDEMHRRPGCIAHQRDRQPHVHDVPGAVKIPFLHLVVVDVPGQQVRQVGEVGVQVGGMRDVLKGLLQEFLRLVADDAAEHPVDLQPVAVQRHQRHADAGVVERLAETLFAPLELGRAFPHRLFQQFRRFLLVMDVRRGADPAHHPARRVALGAGLPEMPAVGAVTRAAQAVLAAVAHAGCLCPPPQVLRGGHVVRMDGADPTPVGGLGFGQAGVILPAAIEGFCRPLRPGTHGPDQLRHGVRHETQAVFAPHDLIVGRLQLHGALAHAPFQGGVGLPDILLRRQARRRRPQGRSEGQPDEGHGQHAAENLDQPGVPLDDRQRLVALRQQASLLNLHHVDQFHQGRGFLRGQAGEVVRGGSGTVGLADLDQPFALAHLLFRQFAQIDGAGGLLVVVGHQSLQRIQRPPDFALVVGLPGQEIFIRRQRVTARGGLHPGDLGDEVVEVALDLIRVHHPAVRVGEAAVALHGHEPHGSEHARGRGDEAERPAVAPLRHRPAGQQRHRHHEQRKRGRKGHALVRGIGIARQQRRDIEHKGDERHGAHQTRHHAQHPVARLAAGQFQQGQAGQEETQRGVDRHAARRGQPVGKLVVPEKFIDAQREPGEILQEHRPAQEDHEKAGQAGPAVPFCRQQPEARAAAQGAKRGIEHRLRRVARHERDQDRRIRHPAEDHRQRDGGQHAPGDFETARNRQAGEGSLHA